jgi:DNA-directed RNA polymerase specialized sigma24 family protein
LSTVDTYFEAEHIFPCFGCLVIVNDDDLAGAISSLTDSQQAIILAYYFLDFSDRQIGEKLGMLRATVQYNRKLALRKMKLYLEED